MLQAELDSQGRVEVGMLLMTSGRIDNLGICVEARLHFELHGLFDLLNRAAVWHELVSFVAEGLQGAVVKFKQGAWQSHDDILWGLWVSRVVGRSSSFLARKIISPWALIAVELFENLEALSLESVACLKSTVFLALDVGESCSTVFVKEALELRV